MTFVISGLTPPPSPYFEKKMTNYFLFFFLVLDHIWVTFGKNKHCEILVSCSDKDGNCIKGLETACKPKKLHACS